MAPLVSVCIITYNQQNYIADAIESALMQVCNFAYDIVICDDCSTDKTAEIIQAYAKKYPAIIKSYTATANIGMLRNWERALKLCSGKYIALLEGDDYWVNNNKLQLQINILEQNPGYVASFTNATIKYDGDTQGFPTYVTITGQEFNTTDLMKNNFIPTCSVVMRNHISDKFFHPAYFKSPFADWIIHVLNSKYGTFHFTNVFTCVYRVHNTGVWSKLTEEKQLLNRYEAINCISEIVSNPEPKQEIRNTRGLILQKICYFYRTNKNLTKYLRYRIKLFFN